MAADGAAGDSTMSIMGPCDYWRDRGVALPATDDDNSLEPWERSRVRIPGSVTARGRDRIEQVMGQRGLCDERFGLASCDEERAVLVWGTARGGLKQIRLACYRCGKAFSQALSQADHPACDEYPELSFEDQAEWASTQRRRLWEANETKRDAEEAAFLEKGRALREAEARTPEGRHFRERVLKRDGGLCQCCLSAEATELHHRLYYDGTRYIVPAWDVVAICRPCHEQFDGTFWLPRQPQ